MKDLIRQLTELSDSQIEQLFHCIGDIERWQHETQTLICRYVGCTKSQAQLIIQLSQLYSSRKTSSDVPTIITSPLDVYNLSKNWFVGIEHEELWILYLDKAKHVVDHEQLTKGSSSFTVVDPRQIFRRALLYRACGIVLIHNHPSGNCMPTRQDIDITKRIQKIGDLLHIPLVDHVIVGTSFSSILHHF